MSTLTAFEHHLIEGRSEKTIENHLGDLRGLEAFVQQREMKFDGTLNSFMINSYKTIQDYEPTTNNKNINSIASYDRFLTDEGQITKMVVYYKYNCGKSL